MLEFNNELEELLKLAISANKSDSIYFLRKIESNLFNKLKLITDESKATHYDFPDLDARAFFEDTREYEKIQNSIISIQRLISSS